MSHHGTRRYLWSVPTTFLLVLTMTCAGTVFNASAATNTSTKSARQVLASALAAALKKGSVRVTVHFVSGKTTGEVVEDSSISSAVETVAIGKERVSILLRGGTAYFTANEQGFVSYFGFPQSVSASLSNQWISVVPTDSSFNSVTAGMTLSSALKEITPTSPLGFGKRSREDGKSTLSITGGGSPGETRTTIFVASQGKPLPVEAVSQDGNAKQETGEIVELSRWGEKFRVPRPSKVIPIASLPQASSSGG